MLLRLPLATAARPLFSAAVRTRASLTQQLTLRLNPQLGIFRRPASTAAFALDKIFADLNLNAHEDLYKFSIEQVRLTMVAHAEFPRISLSLLLSSMHPRLGLTNKGFALSCLALEGTVGDARSILR